MHHPGSSSPLSPQELARYSRHILLPEIGVAGQQRLAAARVLVVGAGGLGSPAALYLAAAGVGCIGIADFDRVEEHNLQRQIVHDSAAVGTLKTESARERLRALNPHCAYELHAEGIQVDNAGRIFGEYDLILDGTDNFPTRYLNNDAAFFARKPLVYGSIFKFEGQVSLFAPHLGGPCYRCLFPEPPPPGSVPNCGEAGVLGALCGVIGSLQALEAIKHLVGIGETLSGRLLAIDVLTQQYRTLRIKRDPDCPLCGNRPRILGLTRENYPETCEAPLAAQPDEWFSEEFPQEISASESRNLIQRNPDLVLLDVREPFETAICGIEGSLEIPMRQISSSLAALPKERPILVYCHSGSRSRRVAEFLREQGYRQVMNLHGGIDAWAKEVDPTMTRY